MTKDDAIKQARDALKNLPGFLADVETAIDACDEALAQKSHPLTPVPRDDTEHGKAYYLASDVDAFLERFAGGGKVMQEPLGWIASMAHNDLICGIYRDVTIYAEEFDETIPIYTAQTLPV